MCSSRPFTLAIALSLAALAGCGRGGSSGFDIGENATIRRALETRQCLDVDELTICPADEPVVGTPSVGTSLDNAASVDCFQTASGRSCAFVMRFSTQGFSSSTRFKVLARAGDPSNAWVVNADPVAESGSNYTATVLLTWQQGRPPARVQLAILAFADSAPALPTEVQRLLETAAIFAFVTPVLSVNLMVGIDCTEAALEAALAEGGSIFFNCGPRPVTISITRDKHIVYDTDIDGGGVITFRGDRPGVQIFYVDTGVTLHLSNAVLSMGRGLAPSNQTAIYNDAGTVTVTNVTFTDIDSDNGGVIFNSYRPLEGAVGSLTITNSTFADNHSISGSTIFNRGEVTVANSTFTRNSSSRGSIIFSQFGTLVVTNSTVAQNTSGGGGALYNQRSAVTLANTIVADNVGGNCSGAITDGGHNLRWPSTDPSCVGVFGDPLLAPLAGNGGPTQTMALETGSAAIDAGDNAVCAAAPVNNLDQRGLVRPAPGQSNCSIGAYEYQSGSACETDFCVFPEVCVAGTCTVATPTPTLPPTATPIYTALPTATKTPGVDDCCQCASSCAAPANGACEIGCSVVYGSSCFGEELCALPTPTPTSAATL